MKTMQIVFGSYEPRNCQIRFRSSIDGDVSSKAWRTKYNTLNNSHEKNAKLSLYMTWRHSAVAEVSFHSLLNSALHKGDWSASRSGSFIPGERVRGTHWIGGWMGPRASLDILEERKISCSLRSSNTGSSSQKISRQNISFCQTAEIHRNSWFTSLFEDLCFTILPWTTGLHDCWTQTAALTCYCCSSN